MKKKAFFGLLYFGQGVPGAFLASALAAHLVMTNQVSREEMAGFLATILIPWSLKIFLAPVADVLWGYRKWVLCMPAVMAACVLAIPSVGGDLRTLFFVAFLCNMAQAMYDISVDAIAVSVSREEEGSSVQAAMRIGEFLGKFVGGAGMIYLTTKFPWEAVCSIAGIVILVSGTLFPWILLRKTTELREAAVGLREAFKSLLSTARKIPVPAVLLALCANICMGLPAGSYMPWLAEVGFDNEKIALLTTFNTWMPIGGALLGGILGAKLGNRRAFLLALFPLMAAYVAIGLIPWTDTAVYATIAVAALFEGFYMVMIGAIFMTVVRDLAHGKKAVATMYATFMALLNLGSLLWVRLGGMLSEDFSISGMFLLGGMCQLIVLIPFVFLKLPGKSANA